MITCGQSSLLVCAGLVTPPPPPPPGPRLGQGFFQMHMKQSFRTLRNCIACASIRLVACAWSSAMRESEASWKCFCRLPQERRKGKKTCESWHKIMLRVCVLKCVCSCVCVCAYVFVSLYLRVHVSKYGWVYDNVCVCTFARKCVCDRCRKKAQVRCVGCFQLGKGLSFPNECRFILLFFFFFVSGVCFPCCGRKSTK